MAAIDRWPLFGGGIVNKLLVTIFITIPLRQQTNPNRLGRQTNPDKKNQNRFFGRQTQNFLTGTYLIKCN